MILLHGFYRWCSKSIAFRHDYCRHCESETTSVLVRTLDVIHIYWVPLLPIGLFRRWRCRQCGNHPHIGTKTRIGFKIAGLIILILMTLSFWLAEPSDDMEPVPLWGFRLCLLLACILTIRSIRKQVDEPSFKKTLHLVQPYAGQLCLLCGGELAIGNPSICTACKAKHLPLEQLSP